MRRPVRRPTAKICVRRPALQPNRPQPLRALPSCRGGTWLPQGGSMTVVSAPRLDWAEAPPLTPEAFLALREMVHPNERAYRRSLLKGATRFFGLDLHREYVVAYAVDEALRPVFHPTTMPW